MSATSYLSSRSSAQNIFITNQKPELVVQMFAAFAFASPSSLGWDETVKGFGAGNDRHYEFTIEDKRYVTKKCISEYAIDTITGRGTRIYLVVDNETGEESVLKDYWNDVSCRRESEIVAEMLEAVRQTYDCETSTASDRKSTRLNSSHSGESRMPSSA